MSALPTSAIIILQAALGMMLLTFVTAVRAGLSRLAAMKGAGIDLEDAAHVSDVRDRLPSEVRRINDNYNHLLEAPTVFYAAALSIVVLGLANGFLAGCAIAYLCLRLAHSVVQTTFNSVRVRAPLYILSWLALAPLILVPAVLTIAPTLRG